jgi:hypothetical protein
VLSVYHYTSEGSDLTSLGYADQRNALPLLERLLAPPQVLPVNIELCLLVGPVLHLLPACVSAARSLNANHVSVAIAALLKTDHK